MQFLYIANDGYTFLVNHDDSGRTLSTLQTLVDGLVDCVTGDPATIGFRADVWVNDEGLFRNDFSINLVASYLTGRQLVGPAVITTTTRGGDTRGLTKEQVQRLINDGLIVDDNDGKGWTPAEAARFGLATV